MITIVFSDTHLTDKFEPAKYNFLKKIIGGADKVIVNGDFWDRYLTSFDAFCRSDWKHLFPILKSKKTIYVFGNHDKKEWSDARINLFSDKQVGSYEFKVGEKLLHIEHGNKPAPAEDEKFPWFPKNKLLISLFILFREQIPLKINDKILFNYYRRQNIKMKIWKLKHFGSNQILICGHSHYAEFSPKYCYINTGFIRFGYGQYLKISQNKLELRNERY